MATVQRQKKVNVWNLPGEIYTKIIEDEVSGFQDDDEWIEDELAKCFSFNEHANPDQGFLYWARRHWYLTDKNGKVILFRPTPLQWHYLMDRHNENVELKARKMGQSTVIDALYYWRARRIPHQHMFVVAHQMDSAAELWSRIMFGHQVLAERRRFMAGPTKKLNRRELEWTDNFSKLRILTAGGKGIGRAADADGIHLSEAAHYDDLKSVLAALGEAKRPGCWVDMESTPNGYDAFREEYIKARDVTRKGYFGRTAHFFPWYMDPRNQIVDAGSEIDDLTDEEGRLMKLRKLSLDQIAWRRQKKSDLGGLFQQEHPEDDETCFLLGGTPLFDNILIREIFARVEREETPLSRVDSPFETGEQFTCWETPGDKDTYVIGADVAEGIPGLAWSVACVVKTTDGVAEQVAEWRGHINPFNFGNQILVPLGEWYNRALLAPERNNHGHATIAGIKESGYNRLYKHRSNMRT